MSPSLAALCCLQAWERNAAIPGGIPLESLLRRIALDRSPASLARIDIFLDALRTARKPQREAFLADRANLNLLDLLAFYVGDVVGRALRCAPEWMWDERAGSGPRGFEQGLACHFPGAQGAAAYMPLVAISERLFSSERTGGVAASAGALLPARLRASTKPLPPAPGFAYPVDWPQALARCTPQERTALADALASPAARAAVGSFFAAAPQVLQSGRIGWGAVVQAHEPLGRPRACVGGAGDVVYDPAGCAPAAALEDVAQVLSGLLEEPVAEPSLPEFSAWLAGAALPASGLEVPSAISPYPLKLARAWFAQDQLPGAVLAQRSLPVVTASDPPGLLVPLPALAWPQVLARAWCAGAAAA